MRVFKKLVIIMSIFIVVLQCITPITLASNTVSMSGTGIEDGWSDHYQPGTYQNYIADPSSFVTNTSFVDQTLTWGSGILYYPIQLVIGLVTEVLEAVASAIAGGQENVTPADVLFNKVALTDINFFDLSGKTNGSSNVSKFIIQVRESVAGWYYAIMTIAIIASLCVLIYIGIRMAISASGEKKGEYKQMFADWLISFALVFVLHFIMMLIIYGNDQVVELFEQGNNGVSVTQQTNSNGERIDLNQYVESLKEKRYSPSLNTPTTEKFGANIVCLLLACLTIAFLIMYIRRFIVIAFLMMIAPLITITYAIDKVKDRRAQAFETWFKEFFWTVLIQPFHCLIYVVFVSTALILIQNGSFASSIMAIVCMWFILRAENIVQKIFGIEAKEVTQIGAASAIVAGGLISTMRGATNAAGSAASSASKKLSEKGGKEKPKQSRQATRAQAAVEQNNGSGDNPDPVNPQGNGGNNPGGGGGGTNINPNSPNNNSIGANTPPNNVDDSQNLGGANTGSEAHRSAMNRFFKAMNPLETAGKIMDATNNSKAYGISKKIIKKYAQLGLQTAFVAATLIGDSGPAKVATAVLAGKAIPESIDQRTTEAYNKMHKTVNNKRLKNKEADMQSSYEAYRKENNFTREQMIEKAEDLMSLDLSTVEGTISEAEKKFAESMQRVYEQHENMGHKNIKNSILKSLKLKESLEDEDEE